MSLLSIVTVPHPSLRKKAESVQFFDSELEAIAENMLETMYASEGIGLAANQVNVLKRLIVFDCSPDKNMPMIMVNPEILFLSEDKEEDDEGCLSLPKMYAGPVLRSRAIKARAQNIKGDFFELEAEDLTARCIQHEIDHLNGVLFIDYLSSLKRERVLKKLERYLREERENEKK